MNKKTLVIGAARSGVAVAGLLVRTDKKVILTDNRPEDVVLAEFPQIRKEMAELERSGVETVFGKQLDPKYLDEVEEIIVSPGVPLTIPIIQTAMNRNIPVTGEIELAYRLTETPFYSITGTNGKTTTTALTGEIFKAAGVHTYVVGNIGDPVCNYVLDSKKEDVFVSEISAFQLDTIKTFCPAGAAILNLSPDHLDRYGEMDNYVNAKMRLFENQSETKGDYLILNADDQLVCEKSKTANSKKYYFSNTKKVSRGAYVQDRMIYLNDGEQIIPVCETALMGIKGPHNVQNALAATALAYFSGKVPVECIKEALIAFKGVEHRQEFVATVNGVDYINDSKGTNTNAAMTALNAMTKPVVLIAGGYDKHENYDDFIELAKTKVKRMILVGATAEAIESAAHRKNFFNTVRVNDYEEAVRVASDCAVKGDVVLLSPACASWDMFDNYEIRGQMFKDLVKRIRSY